MAALVERLHVGPLSPGALYGILQRRLGRVFARPTLLRVHEASGGNPFYALELARALGTDVHPDRREDALEQVAGPDQHEGSLRSPLENRIVPGGTFGWHSHPGPSLVIVKSGALTLYRGDDPDCTPRVIPAGSGFVDNGGDVHLVRNEGSIETVVYVAGATRRIDEPSPGNCSF